MGEDLFRICDFHTHTTFSDGELLPIELIRRAVAAGYQAIALTDHASPGNLECLLPRLRADARLAERHWPIRVLAGVELTHVPAAAIAEAARAARSAGAEIVVVHGETPVEPVEPGTNLAAALSPDVDLLAHPGLLDEETARAAAARGMFVEVTARSGHCLGNGRVVAIGRAAGVRWVVDSDSHAPEDLLTPAHARTVALGAGLREDELAAVLRANPAALLARLASRGGHHDSGRTTRADA